MTEEDFEKAVVLAVGKGAALGLGTVVKLLNSTMSIWQGQEIAPEHLIKLLINNVNALVDHIPTLVKDHKDVLFPK